MTRSPVAHCGSTMPRHSSVLRWAVCLALAGFGLTTQAANVATFDDLALPPALNAGTGLQFTNGSNSLLYKGATWDSRISVIGDQYRVDPPLGPLFGVPRSGNYFVTNQNGDSGISITTSQVLTGAWFGRNQYYGFSEGGADQISIYALHGALELGSVVFDLPESHPGLAEPLSFVDTSSFSGLVGITGYRIDRRELGTQSGNWVADDFQFVDARQTVPEPGTFGLLGLALGLVGLQLNSRQNQKIEQTIEQIRGQSSNLMID